MGQLNTAGAKQEEAISKRVTAIVKNDVVRLRENFCLNIIYSPIFANIIRESRRLTYVNYTYIFTSIKCVMSREMYL